MYHAAGAQVQQLGRLPGGAFGDLRSNPDAGVDASILVLRPDAELFFANAETVAEQIHRAATESDPRPRGIVLDLESTDDLDVPTCDALRRLTEQLSREDITLALARVHRDVQRVLERTGVVDAVGADRVYPRVEAAVMALQGVRTPASLETV